MGVIAVGDQLDKAASCAVTCDFVKDHIHLTFLYQIYGYLSTEDNVSAGIQM